MESAAQTGQLRKIIAILKPGKPNDRPQSYRPIALLSMLYKLLERLIYNRISDAILQSVPIEQAGFRPNRSCVDQVLSLTTHIEAGFQMRLKTSVAFVDLTAAYDTVWRQGLIFKFLRTLPCRKISSLINEMLSNRTFNVVLGNGISKPMKLNNGLPQGSVLAPLLFNLYISDLPDTESRKFGYADDWALATRSTSMEVTERTLTNDLTIIAEYFRKWRLQPSSTKTEVSCFHLNNKMAHNELEVYLENVRLPYNKHPKYLGITLDRTLSFKQHLMNTSAKVNTRNNIIQKLCGSSWGSSPATLRCAALGLVFSAAEYGSAVWLNSPHTYRVDTQLNRTMRMISGTIKSTPTHWLPILSHIAPSQLRRESALVREHKKIGNNPQLPIHSDLDDLKIGRLRSRHPPLLTTSSQQGDNFELNRIWREKWIENSPRHYHDLPCIDQAPPGFELPRKTWTTLNRIRTNHGKCADSLFKWGKAASPACDCGADKQTIDHIVRTCPLRSYSGEFEDFLNATEGTIKYISKLDVSL